MDPPYPMGDQTKTIPPLKGTIKIMGFAVSIQRGAYLHMMIQQVLEFFFFHKREIAHETEYYFFLEVVRFHLGILYDIPYDIPVNQRFSSLKLYNDIRGRGVKNGIHRFPRGLLSHIHLLGSHGSCSSVTILALVIASQRSDDDMEGWSVRQKPMLLRETSHCIPFVLDILYETLLGHFLVFFSTQLSRDEFRKFIRRQKGVLPYIVRYEVVRSKFFEPKKTDCVIFKGFYFIEIEHNTKIG